MFWLSAPVSWTAALRAKEGSILKHCPLKHGFPGFPWLFGFRTREFSIIFSDFLTFTMESTSLSSEGSWLARVNEVQKSRMTPEARQGMLQRAERSRQCLSVVVESSVYQKRSNAAFRGVTSVLQDSSSIASAPPLARLEIQGD